MTTAGGRFRIPGATWGEFGRKLRRWCFLIVLGVLLVTGDWLGKNIVFEPPATWISDILLRTREVQVPRHTRLVRIDEEDRDRVLLGKIPVDGRALIRAVCILAESRPRVIVVDLDTSSSKSFPKQLGPLPDFHGVEVIWAVNAGWERVGDRLALKPDRYLGGNLEGRFGIARMPVGFDGVVREWYREIEVNGKAEASLTEAAVRSYCKGGPDCGQSGEPSLSVDYAFPILHLQDFVPDLPSGSLPGAGTPVSCPVNAARKDARLEGMAVVVGGVHSHEDRHDTPWGSKPGVELVAMSIEESIEPHTTGRLHCTAKWGIKILLALFVAALHHFLYPIAASVLTVLLLPIAVLVAGLAAFWFGEYQMTVVSLVVGVMLEQLATSAEKGQHHARHSSHG